MGLSDPLCPIRALLIIKYKFYKILNKSSNLKQTLKTWSAATTHQGEPGFKVKNFRNCRIVKPTFIFSPFRQEIRCKILIKQFFLQTRGDRKVLGLGFIFIKFFKQRDLTIKWINESQQNALRQSYNNNKCSKWPPFLHNIFGVLLSFLKRMFEMFQCKEIYNI